MNVLDIDIQLYPELKAIYGPYRNNCDRDIVILYFKNLSRRTVSWPKLLYERHIERRIEEPDTIDHIDGDIHNHNLDNLRILHREKNASKYSYTY